METYIVYYLVGVTANNKNRYISTCVSRKTTNLCTDLLPPYFISVQEQASFSRLFHLLFVIPTVNCMC